MTGKRVIGSASRSTTASVDAYLAALRHPNIRAIQALRKAILGVDARIGEEVKWNAPSFFLEDHFATFRLHPGSVFQLVLHTGAKKKGAPKQRHVDDPKGLLKWAAKDRCVLAFGSDEVALAKRADVVRIVKEWIAQL